MVDFAYIGPSRAGSTWFFANMSRHPEVHFPDGKMSHFWDEHYHGGHVYGRKYEQKSLQWYLDTYKPVSGKKVGDVTESYAVMDSDKIQDFYSNCPDTKLFYCLRNPMDIAWSACRLVAPRYLGDLNKAPLDKITEYLRGDWNMCSTKAYEYKNCDPVTNIKKWCSIFPEDQMHTYYFDGIYTQPRRTLGDMSRFLNIDHKFWDTVDEKSLKESVNTGRKITLRNDVKQVIVDMFMPKVEELEKYTGDDLSHWKEKWLK